MVSGFARDPATVTPIRTATNADPHGHSPGIVL
jgi:hypothetical protein